MLSVGESARQLGVSPSRVRALIKEGRLPAAKNGREWMIREEDVLQRLMASPRAGRPRVGVADALGEHSQGSAAPGPPRPPHPFRSAAKPLLARTICTTHVGTRLGTSPQLR